jgi:hypothetical protein
MARPHHKAEFREGSEAVEGFNAALKKILSVSKKDIDRLRAAEREVATDKPKAGRKLPGSR